MSYSPSSFTYSESGDPLRPSDSISRANSGRAPLTVEQQIARAISAGHFENSADMLKAMMDMQQDMAELRKENEILKGQNVDLRLRLKADKNSDVASVEAEMKTEVGRAAKYFVVFMTPSISTESFGLDKPRFAHDSPERFRDPISKKYGITAELYHSIPEKFMPHLVRHDALKKEFLNCLSTGRSSALERFRTNAGRVFIFNRNGTHTDQLLDQALFAKTVVRSAHPRIQALLGLENGGKKFPRLPPILFANEDTTAIPTLFLNPALFRLARLIVYGQTSLDQKDPEKLTMRTNSPYYHPVTKLPPTATPGFISWMSMMASYILSDDPEFNSSGTGSSSGTKYVDNFNFYKEILIKGLASKPHILDLFSTWNREVFPHSLALDSEVPDSRPESCARMGGDHIEIQDVADILRHMSLDLEQNNTTSSDALTLGAESGNHDIDITHDSESDWYAPAHSPSPDPISLPPVPRVSTGISVMSAMSLSARSNQAMSATMNPLPIPSNPVDIVPLAPPKAPAAAKKPTRSSTRALKNPGSTDPAITSTSQLPVVDNPAPAPPKPKRATRSAVKTKK